MIKKRNMWIKQKFLDLILSGKKSFEVRVLYPSLRSIKKGELINFNNYVTVRVKDVRVYSNFEEMLYNEETSRIVPGATKEEVLKLFRALYPPYKEQSRVLVLEIEPVEDNSL
jgi:ASC-1-like (ASCH) protein